MLKKLCLCLGLGAFSLTTLSAGSILQWQDTSVGYRFGTRYREPANTEHITKNILQLTHVNGWAYGSNFVNLDVLFSKEGQGDDKKGGGSGATELYFVYRGTLSYSKIFGHTFTNGIIRDVGLTIGTDLNNKNDYFHSKVRELYVGPTVSFNVPGFLNASLMLDKENNYNGFLNGGQGANVYFDPTWCVALDWGIPLGKTPLTFKGFANFMGSKGQGTKMEILTEVALVVDPFYKSASMKGHCNIGIGFQYWYNKFGNNHKQMPGAIASVPQLIVEYHF